MSGGSYDYIYTKIDELAYGFLNQKPALRRAFGKHLKLVAKAMHDIEWVDSSDYAHGDEIQAIEAVLGDNVRMASLSILQDDARALIEELQKYISITEI